LREYVGGPENALVLTASTSLNQLATGQLTDNPCVHNPIFLYGPPGTGKTELSHTLVAQWQRSHPLRPVRVIDGATYRRGYSTAVGRNAVNHWWKRLAENSMLCLDGVDEIAGRRATEETLVRLIDQFLSEDRPVLVTGSVHPANHVGLSPRLASRLSAGLAVQLRPPGLEARHYIFQQLAQLHQLHCSAAAARYVARHVDGTVGDLSDVLSRLVLAGPAQPPKISEADVRRILVDHGKVSHDVSPEKIIRRVARHFQFSAAQLTGSSRRHSLVRARGVAIYLMRELTGLSLQQIGHCLGNRDHTTILHAYRKTESLIQCDPDIQVAVTEVMASVKGKN
jgi:chromosomal replication initiator protein